MQKILLVALALVAVAVALPLEEVPKIEKYESESDAQGNYKLKVGTSDGTTRDEEGKLTEVTGEDGKPKKVVTVRGSYEYTKDDGTKEIVTFEADQNGYRAFGPSIPKTNVEEPVAPKVV